MKASEKKEFLDLVEDLRKFFEIYTTERLLEKKVIFYIPSKEEETKTPFTAILSKSIADQDQLFPFFLGKGIRLFNQLNLSRKYIMLDERNRNNTLREEFIPYFSIYEPKAWLGINLTIIPSIIDNISKGSLMLQLIQIFENLIDRKIDYRYENLKSLNKREFENNRCLLVEGIKYINLKEDLQDFLRIMKEEKAGYYIDVDEKGELIKGMPDMDSINDYLLEPYNTLIKDVKHEIEKGEGLQRVSLENNKEANGQKVGNIPLPKQNNGNNKNKNTRKRK